MAAFSRPPALGGDRTSDKFAAFPDPLCGVSPATPYPGAFALNLIPGFPPGEVYSRGAAVAVLVGDRFDAPRAGHGHIAALEAQIDSQHGHGAFGGRGREMPERGPRGLLQKKIARGRLAGQTKKLEPSGREEES